MAAGGLHTCPQCVRRVRDADWLEGSCARCGCNFRALDPDFLADEIERQQQARAEEGFRPGLRALIIGAGIAAVWLYIFSKLSYHPDPWLMALSSIPGSLGGLVAWAICRHAHRTGWDSTSIWMVASLLGLLVPPLVVFLGVVLFLKIND